AVDGVKMLVGHAVLGLKQLLVPLRLVRDGGIDDDIPFAGDHHHGVAEADGLENGLVHAGCLGLVRARSERRSDAIGYGLLGREAGGEQSGEESGGTAEHERQATSLPHFCLPYKGSLIDTWN